MPHKHKKNHHAPKNASPRAEKKKAASPSQLHPTGDPFTAPVVAPTNYQEIHQNEVDALRSIYGDDFEEVQHRRSAWQVGRKPPVTVAIDTDGFRSNHPK